MRFNKKRIIILAILLLSFFLAYKLILKVNLNPKFKVGQAIDSLNHVIVYYNGGVSHSEDRNMSKDGYNIGIKYQCVEFVKRYYYQYLNHKMPDTYGNAKDFFDTSLKDSSYNKKRNLLQFNNTSISKPRINDLIVFDATAFNPFGHVAIISKVGETEIEIIQQNPGPFAPSRIQLPIQQKNKLWVIMNDKTLGWLRLLNSN